MVEFVNDPHPGRLTGAIGTAFVLLVNILIMQKNGLQRQDYPYDVGPHLEDNRDMQYDFVIVGAGAAGCVLANRLSEYAEWKVMLVEAGDDPSITSEVPAFYPSLQRTEEDWQFETEPSEKVCQGMINKACRIPKGKVLGGTSSINNLHYTRANPKDFDVWYNMGNNEWNSTDAVFYYERLENCNCPIDYPIHYGSNGPLPLDTFHSEHYIKDTILEAAENLKYGKLQENKYLGYLENVGTISHGSRQNMAKAFLNPVKDRINLFIAKNCYVTKILIPDKQDKKAKGVQCLYNGDLVNIKAKREVILSAGAINTPRLMLLSGLGPAAHLKQLDIHVQSNINVGANLHDHIGVPVFVGVDKDNCKSDSLYDLSDSTYTYMTHRKGPLSTTNINDLVGFINTRNDPYEYPNVMIYHYHFLANDLNLKGFLDGIGYQPEIVKSLLKHNVNQTLIMFVPIVIKPKSRGTVLLNNTNPLQSPIIKGAFLSDEDDADLMTLMSGFKYVMRFIETPAFQKHNAELLQVDIPNCRNLKFCTEFFMKCHIINLAYPQGDVVGTTKMGPQCAPDVVVDEDLLVKGIRGLRVVDASFMPEIVQGNIQATAAMAADKISECIKVKWLRSYQPSPNCKCKNMYK